MDIVVLERPEHIQVRLQCIFDHDLRRITLASVTVIIAVGINQRNDKVVDLIQRPLYCISVAEGNGRPFCAETPTTLLCRSPDSMAPCRALTSVYLAPMPARSPVTE